MKKLSTSYNLNYSSRDQDTHDTYQDISVNFENPNQDELIENLNAWLTAIKSNLKVVKA